MWFVLVWGCAAPKLVVSGPAEVMTGPFELAVTSDASWLELEMHGRRVPTQLPITLDPSDWKDEEHTITVHAGGPLRPSVQATVAVRTDAHGPVIELDERSRTVEQGHTLSVVFRFGEPVASHSLTFLEQERPSFAHGEVWRALVGVPIRTEAGPHPLTIEAVDTHGNSTVLVVPVDVQPVEWVTSGKLPLSKKAAQVEPEGRKLMRLERDAVYALETPEAVWRGAFQMPLEGTHTSAFGTFREYPDGKRSHHDAEDIGQKPGRPIQAAGPGRVALAHMQEVHGNAVLIDHGQGVVSLYSHMSGFAVKEGDTVEAGEVIGYVGSTGRSTGPHLHWGVVVDGVPVDPMQWLETGFAAEDAEFTTTGE